MRRFSIFHFARTMNFLHPWMALLVAIGCNRAKDKLSTDQAARVEETDAVPSPTTNHATPPAPQPMAAPSSSSAGSAYKIPELSEKQLSQELGLVCDRAKGRPILIEFSAPWCSDCRRLQEMKSSPILNEELENWPHLTINIGNFDHHEKLLKHFKIRAIANWQIVQSPNCKQDATTWTMIAHRTLEPTGKDKKVTPRLLAAWLADLR